MKKKFTIPVTVLAFSHQEAEAKIALLLQGGAFIKDFNVPNLVAALIRHFVWAKIGEAAGKIEREMTVKEAVQKVKQTTPSTLSWIKPVDLATYKTELR